MEEKTLVMIEDLNRKIGKITITIIKETIGIPPLIQWHFIN